VYDPTKVNLEATKENVFIKQRLQELEKSGRETGQAELKPAESEAWYRQLFEMEPAAIFLIDNERGRILDVNYAAATLYGYEYEEFLKIRPADLSVEPLETWKDTSDPDSYIPIAWHQKKDGSAFPVEINSRRIALQGRSAYILAVRDITDKHRIEGEQRQNFSQLRKALSATIDAIAVTVEKRDPYTAGHQRRVADLARSIADELGLSADQIAGIRAAGRIHDIGKISIPSEILCKPTALTPLEFALIKMHPQSGYEILKDVEFPWPVSRIVLEHHERLDGSGYPNGLIGDNLLIESRILAVADVVEAMATNRPYRPALGLEAALNEITIKRGVLYDSMAVDACIKLFFENRHYLSEL